MAKASDPNEDTIYYKFELSGPSTGERYVVQQDWSPRSEWIWNSTDHDLGINFIRVSVKDEKHNDPSGNAMIIENYSIADRKMTHGEIGYSNIKKMILGKTYTFSAYVARNDSIEAARRKITTGNDSGERSVPVLNNTLIVPDVYTKSQVFVSSVTIMQPKIQVDLARDVFKIFRQTTEYLTIPIDRRGKNYGIWLWSVTPIEEGTHFLELLPYELPSKTPIGGGTIRIEVTVKENVTALTTDLAAAKEKVTAATEAEAAAKENLTAATEAKAVATEKVAEAKAVEAKAEAVAAAENKTAEAAPATEKKAPGFEGLFAITGLLAVAYLVLGKRE